MRAKGACKRSCLQCSQCSLSEECVSTPGGHLGTAGHRHHVLGAARSRWPSDHRRTATGVIASGTVHRPPAPRHRHQTPTAATRGVPRQATACSMPAWCSWCGVTETQAQTAKSPAFAGLSAMARGRLELPTLGLRISRIQLRTLVSLRRFRGLCTQLCTFLES